MFQIGSAKDETISVKFSSLRASKLSVSTAGLPATGTVAQTKFEALVNTVNTAIATVATRRAKLGAVSNRLDHHMSHLANVSEMVRSSLSSVQDADFAAESTNLAKSQILQQAATSMLAQANASKQTVLSLLQG